MARRSALPPRRAGVAATAAARTCVGLCAAHFYRRTAQPQDVRWHPTPPAWKQPAPARSDLPRYRSCAVDPRRAFARWKHAPLRPALPQDCRDTPDIHRATCAKTRTETRCPGSDRAVASPPSFAGSHGAICVSMTSQRSAACHAANLHRWSCAAAKKLQTAQFHDRRGFAPPYPDGPAMH